MRHVPEIKLIRTDTTLDLSQKAEKVWRLQFSRGLSRVVGLCHTYGLDFLSSYESWEHQKTFGLEPMAQRQRVGFQTRRLGVRIPLGSLFFCPVSKQNCTKKLVWQFFYYCRTSGTEKIRTDKRSPGTDTYLIYNPSHFEHLPGRPWVLIKQDTGVVWSRALALWLLWSAIGMLNALADGVICCCNDFLSQH